MKDTPPPAIPIAALPYRGPFGHARPRSLARLPLPPAPIPSRHGLRPLKAWRYVGVFSEELMLCAALVRIGRARQAFWAVWDRGGDRLFERTEFGRGAVMLAPGRVRVRSREVQFDLELAEAAGIEAVNRSGASYAWTRKQGGIAARGLVAIGGRPRPLVARAIVDDTAAYYERHTSWKWCAGVGTSVDGRDVAWNLVSGVNDPPRSSERTIWVDGETHEPGPVAFAPDLTSIGKLRFQAEAVRSRRENLLVVRSDYRQPFGTFSGQLPGGIELASGYGVMEAHDAWW